MRCARSCASCATAFTGKKRHSHRRNAQLAYCILHEPLYLSPRRSAVFRGKISDLPREIPQPFHLPGERMAAKKGAKKGARKGGAKKAAKRGAKKGGAKKSAKRAAKRGGAKRTPNAAFMRPMQPDAALAAV